MNGNASQCITELCPGSESSSPVPPCTWLCGDVADCEFVCSGCVLNAVRRGGALIRLDVKQGVAAKAGWTCIIKG